jgi:Type II secretion system (T2SS), protein N
MPGKRSWWALGCGAFLAFAFLQFPAATAYRWFAPPGVRMTGIDGTLWSGSADLFSVSGVPMRDLEWTLGKLPLLLGRLSGQFSVRLSDGFANGTVVATPRTVRLSGLQIATSLGTLSARLPLQGAQGAVSATLDELVLRNGWPTTASGRVRVRGLGVRPIIAQSGATLVTLGDYELSNFDVSGNRLAAELHDGGGLIEVDGTVGLITQGEGTLRGARPTFEGRVRERGELPDALREPLEFLTVDIDAEGWRTLDLDPWLSAL